MEKVPGCLGGTWHVQSTTLLLLSSLPISGGNPGSSPQFSQKTAQAVGSGEVRSGETSTSQGVLEDLGTWLLL